MLYGDKKNHKENRMRLYDRGMVGLDEYFEFLSDLENELKYAGFWWYEIVDMLKCLKKEQPETFKLIMKNLEVL